MGKVNNMYLTLIKDNALSILRNFDNVSLLFLNKYNSIDDLFHEYNIKEFYVSSNLMINEFDLKISKDPKIDAQNAIIIYKAMKNLLPIHARDEKIWVYLCFTKCWKYMNERWPIDNVNKKRGTIYSRYFFGESNSSKDTKKFVRNGVARLWWGAYITYDETNKDNEFEYVEYVFRSQDLFVGLLERSFAKNKNVTLSILECIKKYKLLEDGNMNHKLIRKILKSINFSTGLVMYDALDRETIFFEIDKIFKKYVY